MLCFMFCRKCILILVLKITPRLENLRLLEYLPCLETLSPVKMRLCALATTFSELSRRGMAKILGGHGPPGPPSNYLPGL